VTGWPRHALALTLLAALNFGLYGRLYSPLDHAYPAGEAASVAVTRFIAENPDPWGWNPTWNGGRPTQETALPALPYAAVLVSQLGFSVAQAHRIVAVTMALLAPFTLYFLLIAFGGMTWAYALATAVGASVLSPIHRYEDSVLIFLPGRLEYLERTGEAAYLVGLTLVLVAIPLAWRAALDRRPGSLFLASVTMALVALSDGRATGVLAIALSMLSLTMLGIAREFGFSHRRVLLAVGLAYLLSCFWQGPLLLPVISAWPVLLGAVIIRLLFVDRREPLLCFAALGTWSFSYLRYWNEAEIFLLMGLFAGSWRAFQHPRLLYRSFVALAALLMVLRFDVTQWPSFRPMTVEGLSRQVKQWRGDWQMHSPNESEEFRLTRWFAEHPPRGRILANAPLSQRLNAWVPYAQAPWPMMVRSEDAGTVSLVRHPPDASLVRFGGEYVVDSVEGGTLPLAARVGHSVIYRLPFESLAMSVRDGVEDTPLALDWLNRSHIRISGDLPAGHLLKVKVNYHPGWHSAEAALSKADDGFMLLAAPAGPVQIDLQYHGTPAQHFFGYLSAAAWVVGLGYVPYRSRRR
jgi:hypothetical protein